MNGIKSKIGKITILTPIFIIVALTLFLSSTAFAQPGSIEFNPITDVTAENFILSIASFFVNVSVILLIIYIIWIGIRMMISGPNPEKFAQATKAFQYVLIGGLVILGAGVIMSTIAYFIVQVSSTCISIIFGFQICF